MYEFSRPIAGYIWPRYSATIVGQNKAAAVVAFFTLPTRDSSDKQLAAAISPLTALVKKGH